MRRLITMGAVLGLVLAGCGTDTTDTAPEEDGELETTSLRLGFGVDPVFAPHIAAIELGYFEEAGFTDIETTSFTSGQIAGEAVAAGEIELWTPGNVPPISMIHNGVPIVVLGTNTTAYLEQLVVRSDAIPQEPEDLLDLTIGLLEGSTASAVLANIAEAYDLDPLEFTTVNLPPPEQMTSISTGEIDAFLVWNPWPYLAVEDPDLDVEILHTGTVSNFPWDQGSELRTSSTRSLWVTSEDFIVNSPNAAAAMTEALLRGQEYVANPANRDEVITMVSEFLEQPVEQNEALWDGYEFTTAFDQAYVDDMQAYTEFLAETGRIADAMDPMSYTYTGFVERYDAALVDVEGDWSP